MKRKSSSKRKQTQLRALRVLSAQVVSTVEMIRESPRYSLSSISLQNHWKRVPTGYVQLLTQSVKSLTVKTEHRHRLNLLLLEQKNDIKFILDNIHNSINKTIDSDVVKQGLRVCFSYQIVSHVNKKMKTNTKNSRDSIVTVSLI